MKAITDIKGWKRKRLRKRSWKQDYIMFDESTGTFVNQAGSDYDIRFSEVQEPVWEAVIDIAAESTKCMQALSNAWRIEGRPSVTQAIADFLSALGHEDIVKAWKNE